MGPFRLATPGYFETLGIPVIRGRTFRWTDTGRDGHGIILGESLARSLFGDQDPIGRRVRWATRSSDPDYTVVGVVGDGVGHRIEDGPSRAFYFPNIYPPKADTITGVVHYYIPADAVYVVRSRLAVASLVPAVQRAVREVDPKLPVTDLATLPQLLADSMARTRLTLLLLFAGAAVAIVLGMTGIYTGCSPTSSAFVAQRLGYGWLLARLPVEWHGRSCARAPFRRQSA